MKKIIICTLFVLINIGYVFSQIDAQMSQYMFNTTSFNPAAVGENDMIQLIGQHRIQWIGLPSGGHTTFFSFNGPLHIGKSTHGIGFQFINDKISLFSNQYAYFQYAYKHKLGTGTLSIGTSLGFASIGFNSDSIKNHDITLGGYHHILSDNAIPKSNVAGIGFDMTLGAYYATPVYYGGVSFLHLTKPVISWDDRTSFPISNSMFLTGGYKFTLSDPKFVIEPSILYKTDFATWQIDVSGLLEYDNHFWGGLTYRHQDAIVFLAGINISGGLSIGYSYDLITSQMRQASSGSHELLLKYAFPYVPDKRKNRYKSIRIL